MIMPDTYRLGSTWTSTVSLVTMVTTCLVMAANTQFVARYCELYNGVDVCYTIPDANLTFTEAFEYCLSVQSTDPDAESVLARVYNPGLQDRLQEFMINNSIQTPVWISATTENPEDLDGNPFSQWRWVYECTNCDTSRRADWLALQALNQQGCYSDSIVDRDLPVLVSGTHDATSCQGNCTTNHQLMFSGLQLTQQCRCGSSFGKYGPAEGCVNQCGPSNKDNCGGATKNFVYREGGRFGDWGYEQPDNKASQKQFCGAAKLGDIPNYQYFDENCGNTLPYVCSYDSAVSLCSSQPDPGYYLNTTYGSCVYLSLVSDAVTWYRARQYCRNRGGDLVTFNNFNEHMEVIQFVTTKISADEVYIGLQRSPLVWKKVYQDAEMSYYNMAPGEPQFISGEDSNCLVIDPNDNHQWRVAPCGNQNYFICFEGPSDDPAPTTTAPSEATTTSTIGYTNTGSMTSTSTSKGTTSKTTSHDPDSTTSLVEGSSPGGSTNDDDGLTRTEKILIGTLTAVGILLILFLILFLVCRKEIRDKESKISPSPKSKIDARLKATQPESGPLWDINDGYQDMGSTANLMLRVKKMVIPKWKAKAKSTSRAEPEDAKVEEKPDMLRRRTSDTESVLVPDLLRPLDTAAPGSHPESQYEYAGTSPINLYESPQGSRTALIRSYSSVPRHSVTPEHRPSLLPGQTDYDSSHASISLPCNDSIQEMDLEDPPPANPRDIDSQSVDEGPRVTDQTPNDDHSLAVSDHDVTHAPQVDIESVSDVSNVEDVDEEHTDTPRDSPVPDSQSADSSPRESDTPLVRSKSRDDARTNQVDRDDDLAAVAI